MKETRSDYRKQMDWSGDLRDDCTVYFHGLTLRAEWMNRKSWWWAVTLGDGDTIGSSNDHGEEIRSGAMARRRAEDCAVDWLCRNAGSVVEYEYRVIESSWGILIRLAGSLLQVPEDGTSGKIDNYFASDCRVDSAMKKRIDGVFDRMQNSIARKFPGSKTTAIFSKVDFNPTDFQIEGLEHAMILWICKAVGATPPKVDIAFNRDENRYVYTFHDNT